MPKYSKKTKASLSKRSSKKGSGLKRSSSSSAKKSTKASLSKRSVKKGSGLYKKSSSASKKSMKASLSKRHSKQKGSGCGCSTVKSGGGSDYLLVNGSRGPVNTYNPQREFLFNQFNKTGNYISNQDLLKIPDTKSVPPAYDPHASLLGSIKGGAKKTKKSVKKTVKPKKTKTTRKKRVVKKKKTLINKVRKFFSLKK